MVTEEAVAREALVGESTTALVDDNVEDAPEKVGTEAEQEAATGAAAALLDELFALVEVVGGGSDDAEECVDDLAARKQLQAKEEGAVLKELARSRFRREGGAAEEEDDALVDMVEGLSRGKALVASALAHDTQTPSAVAVLPRAVKVKVE